KTPMRTSIFSLVALFVIHAASPFAFAEEPRPMDLDLEDAQVGRLPPGWIVDRTGNGRGSVWLVVEDNTAPRGPKVMGQFAESPKHLFNLCLAGDSYFLNGVISVGFKVMDGKTDLGGGIVWRYANSNNYYLACVDCLQNNVRIYKVV